MIQTSVQSVQSAPAVDRETLRAGLEAARATFHKLLDTVAGKRWREKSPSSAWTLGEVCVHLTWSVEYLPQEIAMARQGKGMFNDIPNLIANPLSYWYIRWIARNSTPASLRQRYDAAIDATIKAIDTVPDSDWLHGAQFYGERFYTVADLFQTPAEHLAEHTSGL